MVRVGRRAAAHDTWLLGHEFEVILVAQANGLGDEPGSAGGGLLGGGL
jgi:hypothetical protein